MRFEYKVVPAPTRGKKAKGVKTTADRFALALSEIMNEMAAEGWEYQRTDTLPAEERQGLTGRSTSFQNMLVFRRSVNAQAETEEVTPVTETAETAVQSRIEMVEDSVESHAPALPSSDEANALPDTATPAPEADRRDVAAE